MGKTKNLLPSIVSEQGPEKHNVWYGHTALSHTVKCDRILMHDSHFVVDCYLVCASTDTSLVLQWMLRNRIDVIYVVLSILNKTELIMIMHVYLLKTIKFYKLLSSHLQSKIHEVLLKLSHGHRESRRAPGQTFVTKFKFRFVPEKNF